VAVGYVRPTVASGWSDVSLSGGGTAVDLELALEFVLEFVLELLVGADERIWEDISPLSPSSRIDRNLAGVCLKCGRQFIYATERGRT